MKRICCVKQRKGHRGREKPEILGNTRSEEKNEKKWEWKEVKERTTLHGFMAGLSCLLLLRDQPIPPKQEGSGLSQHTQAALLAEALWHGCCGCCCQSMTASSYSLLLFSPPLCNSPSPTHSPLHSSTVCIPHGLE